MTRVLRVLCGLLPFGVVIAFAPLPALAQETVHGVPRGLVVDGVGCLAPEAGRVTGSAPMLAGQPWYSEGTARARVELRTGSDTTNLRTWLSSRPSPEPRLAVRRGVGCPAPAGKEPGWR